MFPFYNTENVKLSQIGLKTIIKMVKICWLNHFRKAIPARMFQGFILIACFVIYSLHVSDVFYASKVKYIFKVYSCNYSTQKTKFIQSNEWGY